MATPEERVQILRMIENGQINAEEGASLLEALERASEGDEAGAGGPSARWFRVRVTDMHTGKAKVSVNIPMGLVDVGMRMGAKFAPEMAGVDAKEVMAAIRQGTQGKIIDVEDHAKSEHVEIYVE